MLILFLLPRRVGNADDGVSRAGPAVSEFVKMTAGGIRPSAGYQYIYLTLSSPRKKSASASGPVCAPVTGS